MATYVKSSSFGDFKAYYTYETSSSNTSHTIKVTNAGLYQSCSYSQYPWKTVLSATDYSSTTKTKETVYWTKGYHALITSDKSYTYKRKTSSYTVTIKAKTSKNISDGSNGTASKSFTIPALPSYTISYNANGGSGAPSSQTKYYGINLTLSSAKPTRTGYTFLGWSTSKTATTATWKAGGTYSTNAGDELFAVWQANTYAVSYDANGGSGAPSGQTKTYGVNLTLSSVKPTRERYKFVGWNTNSSGTGTSYSAGGTYSANSAVTLYAVWAEDYIPPSINQPVAYRTNGSAMADDGKYAVVSFTYTKGKKSGQDVTPTSLVVQYREHGTTAWSTAQTITSYTGSVTTNHFGGNALSPEKQYDVQVVLTDAYGSATATTFISRASFSVDVNAAGDVVSIGEAASDSESDLFSVAWDARLKKDVEIKGNLKVNGRVSTIYFGNQYGIRSYTSDDSKTVPLLFLNSSNNLIVGNNDLDVIDSMYLRTRHFGVKLAEPAEGAAADGYFIPLTNGSIGLGSSNYEWYKVYAERLEISASKPVFPYIGSNGSGATVSYATNMYVASGGTVSRTTNTSSRTIKHDIQSLQSDELNAERLYDLPVYQAKYNEDVLSSTDERYLKDLPMFIIEDMDEVYPVAVDKPSDNVKEWSWNSQYLIPPMLKLIQDQHNELRQIKAEIAELKKMLNNSEDV